MAKKIPASNLAFQAFKVFIKTIHTSICESNFTTLIMSVSKKLTQCSKTAELSEDQQRPNFEKWKFMGKTTICMLAASPRNVSYFYLIMKDPWHSKSYFGPFLAFKAH